LMLRRATAICFVLAMSTFHSGCGGSHRWTERRAESIREVRGYPLRHVDCRVLKRAFACSGVTGEPPIRVVLVTYILHPRDPGYYLTNVRFLAFGVP
jgi:hypothetical protein